MNWILKIKYRIRIALGKCRCSGYKVYPNGIRCSGCKDCKGKNNRVKLSDDEIGTIFFDAMEGKNGKA